MNNKRKLLLTLSTAAIIAMVAVVYAQTILTISNSGVVGVSTGPNILISLTAITSTTICSPSTGPYSDSGLSITAWSLTVGGPSQTVYACVWNNSSQPKTLTILGTNFPNGVTFSSTGGGVPIPALAYGTVTFTLTADTSASTGPFTGASVSIT